MMQILENYNYPSSEKPKYIGLWSYVVGRKLTIDADGNIQDLSEGPFKKTASLFYGNKDYVETDEEKIEWANGFLPSFKESIESAINQYKKEHYDTSYKFKLVFNRWFDDYNVLQNYRPMHCEYMLDVYAPDEAFSLFVAKDSVPFPKITDEEWQQMESMTEEEKNAIYARPREIDYDYLGKFQILDYHFGCLCTGEKLEH